MAQKRQRRRDGWMDGREGGMGGYLKEDCVRASSLGSICVSKYGGICYCMKPVLKTDQGENWRVAKGGG